jgi:hypothetical protein
MRKVQGAPPEKKMQQNGGLSRVSFKQFLCRQNFMKIFLHVCRQGIGILTISIQMLTILELDAFYQMWKELTL